MPNLRTFVLCGLLGGSAAAAALAPQPAAEPPAPARAAGAHSAVTPAPREHEGWMQRHRSFNERAARGARHGDIGVVFLGDSITQGWEGPGAEVWARKFAPLGAVNFGISGDRTQHVLWRLRNGNLEGLASPAEGAAPRAVVLMIGTNNSNGEDNTAEEIAEGVGAIVAEVRERLPETRVLLLGIFPRGQHPNPQREKIARANEIIAGLADGDAVRYLDIGPVFLEMDGSISPEVMPDALHLSPMGYELWAASIERELGRLMAGEPGR